MLLIESKDKIIKIVETKKLCRDVNPNVFLLKEISEKQTHGMMA